MTDTRCGTEQNGGGRFPRRSKSGTASTLHSDDPLQGAESRNGRSAFPPYMRSNRLEVGSIVDPSDLDVHRTDLHGT